MTAPTRLLALMTLTFALSIWAHRADAGETQLAAGIAIADGQDLYRAGPAVELYHDTPAGHGAWRLGVAWIGDQEVTPDGYHGQHGTIEDFWLAGAQGVYKHQVGRATLEAGLGLAYRTEATNADYVLPSRLNFDLTLGARIGRLTVQVRHLSNAWTKESNRGQNWIQAALAF